MEDNGNGFKEKIAEFRGAVGVEIKNLHSDIDKLQETENDQWEEIRNLQINASKVGVITGIITALITSLIVGLVPTMIKKLIGG